MRRLRYHARPKLQRKRGLLSLFLTLLKNVKRLEYIAEVANKTPTTIHYVIGSRKIEIQRQCT